MIRLCLETAARCLGVALMDGEIVRAEFLEERTHSQSALLFPALEDLLRTSGIALEDVTEIALSAGPGSFTGLRVGGAAARALADARNIPLSPVPTLMALALGAESPESGWVAMSRVRGEAFVQAYEVKSGAPRPGGTMEVLKYEAIAALSCPRLVCDAGVAEALEALGGGPRVQVVTPCARWVGRYAARAGRPAPAREFFPEYGPSPVYRKRGQPA